MSDYIAHFGLKKAPFSTTPDPAFAFATREHQQALAKIAYYTEERRGIFLLLGEVGTGKTTISQLTINRQSLDTKRKSLCVAGLHKQPVFAVDDHFTDLAQPARDDPFAHRQIFKQLRRRAEKLSPIR